MNSLTALAYGTGLLTKAGIDSARLDTLVLLEDCLHQDRAWILAHPGYVLSQSQYGSLARKLNKRASHQPLAYVRGHSEFYGRRFKVNHHVLEPRPESEAIIELLKKLSLPKRPAIADVGTGSGCLGVTAALEIPNSTVDLYDISSSALGVAKHNSVLHELHLQSRKMNLLARPLRTYDIILANLPYVPSNYPINKSASMEPRLAIFGGRDGLDPYRALFKQLSSLSRGPTYVITESLGFQHRELAKIAKKYGYKLVRTSGLAQLYQSARTSRD